MDLPDSLYGLVIFLSAALLFLVEPITAKRLLPMLGGSAAVWITCLVFFQTALLAGYLYAHVIASRLRPRMQALVHTVVLALALAALAVHVQPDPAAVAWRPLVTTLGLLTAMIGLPFVALAATTPLVQSWHAPSRKSRGWRLYALSNLGSMLALLAYPALVEPHMPLGMQRATWAIGFAVFAGLCTATAWRHAFAPEQSTPPEQPPVSLAQAAFLSRALWVLLPAASSMLLCAVTAHLSQNIAAIPLLWIVPLAAYLLSFIVTFAGPRWYLRSYALRTLAVALAMLAYLIGKHITVPLAVSIPVYVGALFVFCYVCHGELYRLRPAAERPTEFYLLLSLGSALGAISIGVAAPMIFRANYDLALSLIFLAGLAVAATWNSGILIRLFWTVATAAMIWAAVLNARWLNHNTISQLRSFYGSLRVTQTFAIPGPGIERTLFHGTIQHGIQIFNDQLRDRPTSYYALDSGVGLAIRLCCGNGHERIGAVGLGTGIIAAYGLPGDSITFYEIDPLVERLARARFTYLRESRAKVDVILGDARLSLEREAPQNYDVLVLDAFSGDAIPVHLLTAQAIALYRRHLKPNGVLAFHISSQYVDLAPVLAAEAQHAGLTAFGFHADTNTSLGEFQSDWVLMSAKAQFFRQPEVANAANPLPQRPDLPLWTDDFNSLLPLVKWAGMGPGNPPSEPGK
jgi:SAM-dependent methyltransferase